MAKVLVIAENDEKNISHTTLTTLGAAKLLSPQYDLLVLSESKEIAEQASKLEGVAQVLLYQDPQFRQKLAEDVASVIIKEAENYTHILAPATTFGKNVMPRVAAKCKVMQISDITSIETEDIFIRPIYAGNALAKVKSHDKIKILTVRPTAFSPVIMQDSNCPIQVRETTLSAQRIAVVSLTPSRSKRPELSSAKIVVAGGRGLKNKENFKMLETLADELGAAIGASRAAVDAGFISNDFQIGQTGKVVAPMLYIAIGISGAIQHLAGMLESKIIVAINQDPEAPIFEIASYGLVGDLFKIVPELCEALKKIK